MGWHTQRGTRDRQREEGGRERGRAIGKASRQADKVQSKAKQCSGDWVNRDTTWSTGAILLIQFSLKNK
jgi:hypothetical protein